MLSRVAERLYWTARYLERAEDTARLVSAYSHLILDVPTAIFKDWVVLIDIIDAQDSFQGRYKNYTERNVVKYLLSDIKSPSSIRHSVRSVRENVRTTRDVLPGKLWELVNELYLMVEAESQSAISRQGRFDFLEDVIARIQQINGLMASNVSRDQVLWFLQLGQMIERSDMTSRLLDVGDAIIIDRSERRLTEVPTLWNNLLASLSARSAFRRKMGPEMEANAVFNFLLVDQQFPRSLFYCFNQIEEVISLLKPPSNLLRMVRAKARKLAAFRAEDVDLEALHERIDSLQKDIEEINGAVHDTWFGVDEGV